jgi:hypothetical protein
MDLAWAPGRKMDQESMVQILRKHGSTDVLGAHDTFPFFKNDIGIIYT